MSNHDPIRAALERLIHDISELASESEGVYGLHLSGDPSPWSELLEGGEYSAWLGDALAAARAALATPPAEDGPAVPQEGREPAAVVGKVSDEDLYDLAELFNGDPVPAMRRALELWGRPTPAPVEGEVGEPSDEDLLRTYGQAKRDYCYEGDLDDWPKRAERAATVAGLRAVLSCWGRPVSPRPATGGGGRLAERPWERPGWRDPDGECWWCPPDGPARWSMINPAMGRRGWLLPHWAVPHPPATPAPAPVEGEVGELLQQLRQASDGASAMGQEMDSWAIARAATLLEQQVTELAVLRAGVQVPVVKRPRGQPGWCDAEGRCWMGVPGGQGFIPSWRFCRPEDAPHMTCSLPHWAIPQPPQGGEVE